MISIKKEDEANKNAIAANADFSLLSDDDPNLKNGVRFSRATKNVFNG